MNMERYGTRPRFELGTFGITVRRVTVLGGLPIVGILQGGIQMVTL
jgi:hypothetical protein